MFGRDIRGNIDEKVHISGNPNVGFAMQWKLLSQHGRRVDRPRIMWHRIAEEERDAKPRRQLHYIPRIRQRRRIGLGEGRVGKGFFGSNIYQSGSYLLGYL